MHFVTMALYNLLRRPLRTALTGLGVALAVGCSLTMLNMSRGLERGWIQALMDRGTHILGVRRHTAEILTGALDARLGERIAAEEGVRSVCGELVDMTPLEDGHTMLVCGWPEGGFLWSSLRFEAGGRPPAGSGDSAVLGQAAADALNLGVGGSFRMHDREFRVAGVARQGGSSMGSGIIMIPLRTMQELMGLQDRVTAFNIQVAHPDDTRQLGEIRERLSRKYDNVAFWETKEVAEKNDILRLLRALARGIATVAIAMGALVVLNTLLMSVTERTREIGILAALGWTSARILGMIWLEGLLLSTAGSVAGIGIGAAAMRGVAGAPRLQGFFDASLPPGLLAAAVAAGLAVGSVASLYPAWRAVRLNTMDAIRHE
jgi:putative ABC transport system permease protein